MNQLEAIAERSQRSRAPRTQRGYTLLELITVLVILGVLATAAAGSLQPQLLGNIGSRVDARRLASDLIRARRLAIASGRNHAIVFNRDGRGTILSYAVFRRETDGTLQPVDPPHEFPSDVTVTLTSSVTPEFNLRGEALAGCTLELSGPSRAWEIAIARATGAVRTRET